MARAYFVPKKVESENRRKLRSKAHSMKAIQQINDVEKGVIGAVETLTQVGPNASASVRK